MATHRTPSLRLKSSWSGSPLRWKTAMTPLWMLRVGERGVSSRPHQPSLPALSRAAHPAWLEEQMWAWPEARACLFSYKAGPGEQGSAILRGPCPHQRLSSHLTSRSCTSSPSIP